MCERRASRTCLLPWWAAGPADARSGSMNSASNVINASPAQTQTLTPGAVSWRRQMYWSVRRELWESKSIYIAPIAAAALTAIACSVSALRLPERLRAAAPLDPRQQVGIIEGPFDQAGLLIMGVTFLVALFYSLDALHGERRDRSILFWKSLPVSDLTTVLAKASIPFVVLPLLTFAITLVLQFVVLLVNSALLVGNGFSLTSVWIRFPVVENSLLMLYHIVTAHALWPTPIYCWLLLVSGWARRAAFLWAALPVVAIAGVEMITLHTWHFATLVGKR